MNQQPPAELREDGPPVVSESPGRAGSAAHSPHSTPTAFRRVRIRTYIGVFATLFGLSLAINAALIQNIPRIAPIDGIVYIDALDRAMHGEAVGEGTTLREFAREVYACESFAIRDPSDPTKVGRDLLEAFLGSVPEGLKDCDGQYLDLDYWNDFPSPASVHPPSYFFLTAAGVQVVRAAGLTVDSDTAGRLVNAVWFGFGGLLMVALAVMWGARPWPATAVVAALGSTPALTAAHGFVTPDAMALIVGSALVIGVTAWWQRGWSWWSMIPFGLLCLVFKTTFILAAFPAAILILALAVTGRRRWRESLSALGGLGIGVVLSVLAWRSVHALLVVSSTPHDYANDIFRVQLSPRALIGFLGSPTGIHSGKGSFLFDRTTVGPNLPAVIAIALLVLLLGAVLWLALRGGSSPVRALAWSALTVGATASLAFALLGLVHTGILLPVTPRYVLVALPLYALPLMILAQRRWLWIPLSGCAMASLVSLATFS